MPGIMVRDDVAPSISSLKLVAWSYHEESHFLQVRYS